MSIDRVWGIPIAGLDRIHGIAKAGIDRIHGLSGIPADDGGTPATLPTPTYYWSLDDKLTDEIGSNALATSDTPAYAAGLYGNGLEHTDFTGEFSAPIIYDPTSLIVSAWIRGSGSFGIWTGVSGSSQFQAVNGGGSETLRHAVFIVDVASSTGRLYHDGVLYSSSGSGFTTLQDVTLLLSDVGGSLCDEACIIVNAPVGANFTTWANSIAAALYNSGVGMIYREGSGWIDPGEAI